MDHSRDRERLLAFFNRVDGFLLRAVVIVGAAVIVVQLALSQTSARKYLSFVDQLEGQQIHREQIKVADAPLEIKDKSVTAIPGSENVLETRLMIISLIDPLPTDKVSVRVNEKVLVPFINGEAALRISEGDVIEVDASKVPRKLVFSVSIPHNNIEFPGQNQKIESQSNVISIGKIRFKR